MSARDFLFEIGGEELPPKSLSGLASALADGVLDGLTKAGLSHDGVTWFAAPRRLAVQVRALAPQQPDRVISVDGPPVQAAFTADGQPTQAALGFARKNGVGIDELDRSGDKLRFRREIRGEQTASLLPGILDAALKNLPVAKRMRWGSSRAEFVRPMHWLVMLYGEDVVPATLLELDSGRISHGHRFHHPQAIEIASAADYLPAMRQAHVIADFSERRELIRARVTELAAGEGGQALMPEALLDEVTALVEWPVPLVCSFESRFLAVPQEALISTMQDNQKYFCLVDGDNRLMARFITVANIDSPAPEKIIAGNEKVVRPRLTDAEFFFQQDKKITLAERNERLRNVVFQAQLGTVHAKSERVSALAAHIAGLIGADVAQARLAGSLCKSDLASEMVSEFPELQGIAGYHYALHEGLPEPVALALNEQYLPRFAGDVLPTQAIGQAVALADKLDTLTGIFGIGQPPTGSRDPYALRRAALGVLRILIEGELALDLEQLVLAATAQHGAALTSLTTAADVFDFLLGRYRAMYEEQGFTVDVIQSVQACRPKMARDFDRRVRAVAQFRLLPEASALAAAHKRVSNILAKEAVSGGEIERNLLQPGAEQALFDAISRRAAEVAPLFASGDYSQALSILAGLKEVLDAFFNEVMVMAEDAAVRANRLRLLSWLRTLFLRVADISHLSQN